MFMVDVQRLINKAAKAKLCTLTKAALQESLMKSV